MKALVRNKGETITENDISIGIDWDDGMPLTSPYWSGGPYRLIENYNQPDEFSEEDEISNSEHEAERKAERKAEIAQLKARLVALENEL